MNRIPNSKMGYVLAPLVVPLLLGLPTAVWLDLSKLVETNLHRQASDVNSIISSVRNYYANNVVGRVLASPGTTKVIHNYKVFPGAIPIPATLSLELGKVISEQQRNINYRFVSEYPFKNRAPHASAARATRQSEVNRSRSNIGCAPWVGFDRVHMQLSKLRWA